MNKVLFKNLMRDIEHSLGRFISIMAIAALGVAFFAGISASSNIMKHTADTYYDEYNLMDIKLISTVGITNDDLAAFKKVKGVAALAGGYTLDTLTYEGTNRKVTKVITYPMGAKRNDASYLNQLRLVSGRFAQNSEECVLEAGKFRTSKHHIGDTITLYSGDKSDLKQQLKRTSFKIVGLVNTPYYLSYEKGASKLGSGIVDDYIVVADQNRVKDYYNEAYVKVKNVTKYNSYTDDQYRSKVKAVVKELKRVAKSRNAIIYHDAEKKIAIAQADYDRGKATYDQEISSAQNKLDAWINQLNTAKAEYDNKVALLGQQKADYQVQYPKLEAQKATLLLSAQQLSAAIQQLQLSLNDPTLSDEAKVALQGQKEQLQAQLVLVNDNINNINMAESTAQNTLDQANEQLKAAKLSIDAQYAQYNASLDAFNQRKSDGKITLNQAKDQISAAKVQLKQLKDASWYILDRQQFYSFVDYGNAADRMAAIAKVFPVFFFLVAALVCLTSMTRMVDESREQIGTLKALGYGNGAIAAKYLIYAALASIIGGIIGAFIGMFVFPSVIYNAWGIMYYMIDVQIEYDYRLVIEAVGIVSAITLLATLSALLSDIKATPAILMRPKAPKDGKKILLERITLIWSHLSFTHKVTFRNLFRYKKRFLMTVIGISGCSALLVAGFGIRDSINDIAVKQFNDIYKFDISVNYAQDASEQDKAILLKQIKADNNIDKAADVGIYSGLYRGSGEDKSITLYVINHNQNMEAFIGMKERKSQKPIHLSKNGVVITEKVATDNGLKVGDYFKVDNGKGIKQKLKIRAIMENYVGHAIYMDADYYAKIYHEKAHNTIVFALLKDDAKTAENATGTRIIKLKNAASVTYYSHQFDNFQDTIASLNMIIYVLTISAGLLAFVVLYNLSTVNIEERIREIATIKVLGFNDREVSAYIYRESLILSLIGALVGLVIGVVLHGLIMNLAELDNVMFGRNIEPLSFGLAIIITMAFSVIVNIVMYYRLRKIKMVESLKSVE